MIPWKDCPDVERILGKVSGRWLMKCTRIPVQAVLDNAEDFTPEQIVAEIYEGLPVERVRRVIEFARRARTKPHAPRPA